MRRMSWLIALALMGCGGGDSAPEQPRAAERETVFDPLVGTIDRAKGVQQTVDQQAADLRRRVDEAEQ